MKAEIPHLYLSGQNGYALPRTVFHGEFGFEEEIGTVSPIIDREHLDRLGVPQSCTLWKAVSTDGTNHGDTYTTDWNAAKQLALALGKVIY